MQFLTRRTFLRGVGVTMALPWMESLPVWGDEPPASYPPRAEQRSPRPPRRALLRQRLSQQGVVGAGRRGRRWNSARCSRRSLPHREKLLFVRGLYNAEALKGNIHSSQTGNLLSGAPLAAGGEIRSGTSIDQLLAQRYGQQTKVPSLVLGCEKSNPSVHKNYSMLYSSHISWSSPTTPTPLELYPALAFDRLFKDEVEQGRQERARCRARRRRATCAASISTADQRKLDEYLDSVREVEQRIEHAGKRGELQGWRPTLDKPNIAAPGRRHSAGHRRAHAADVRHPRARRSRPTPRASAR